MLAILSEKLAAPDMPANIELIQGTAENTTLGDASCDVVFLANVWHELEDTGAALRECARVLRPEGRLAILDWGVDVSRPPGPPLDHRVSAEEAAKSLSDAGWSVRDSSRLGGFSYLLTAAPPANPHRR